MNPSGLNIVAVIPARGGSKGVPGKNIIQFCDRPLITWSIKQAIAASSVTSVWVSSDDEDILDVSTHAGAETIRRPMAISGDMSPSELAWKHAITKIEKVSQKIDLVVALQPTSPLREALDIDQAVKKFLVEGYDSLFSACAVEDRFVWSEDANGTLIPETYDFKNRKPRQKITTKYLENGSIYIFTPNLIFSHNNRLGGRIGMSIMESYKMFQIDSFEDLAICEAVMRRFGLDNQ